MGRSQDFGGKVLGQTIEMLTADHQNKADVAAPRPASGSTRQNLTMLVGGTNSGTALAMAKVAAGEEAALSSSSAPARPA